MATRTSASKRRAISRDMLEPQKNDQIPSGISTPSPPHHFASAPTSRLKKRSSRSWPLSASWNARGSKTAEPTPERIVQRSTDGGQAQGNTSSVAPRPPVQDSFTLDPSRPDSPSPFQLRPRSSISSRKSGSPAHTSRPGSESFSQSNGSSAPMLPYFGDFSAHVLSRNKLVKRSSSQRALSGGGNLHSTLRRPATSHQRSATMQRQIRNDPDLRNHGLRSSPLPYALPENHPSVDEASQRWQPFFKRQNTRGGQSGSTKKRSFSEGTPQQHYGSAIIPDWTELPTLLMASSLSSSSSDDALAGRPSNLSHLSRPFTPMGMSIENHTDPETPDIHATPVTEPRPRTSFSLNDIFPTPSPLSWKMPRGSSFRSKKTRSKPTGGRRVVSAPQTTETKSFGAPSRDSHGLGTHTFIYSSRHDSTPSKTGSVQPVALQRPPSSPLPPLNRLSTFQVELPQTIPSYPSTPQPRPTTESFNSPPVSSSPASSPRGHLAQRIRNHGPSATHSDHTSTLTGSENDNSRILSGDEDDTDGRSSTIYDSMRTRATSSSFSGNKRSRIDTIFDESPPPETYKEDFLLHMKGLRIADQSREHGVHQSNLPSPINDVSMGNDNEASDWNSPKALQSHQNEFNQVSDSSGQVFNSVSRPDSMSLDEAPEPHGDDSEDHTVPHLSDRPRSRRSLSKRMDSPPMGVSKPDPFDCPEPDVSERNGLSAGSGVALGIHNEQRKVPFADRQNGRRGPTPLHIRSKSVPVSNENHIHGPKSKRDPWARNNKPKKEKWDEDFDFEEVPEIPKLHNDGMRLSLSSGMLVPQAILERQASVHGQFGHVKELTQLVDELKRLQQIGEVLDITNGQAAELWKEAEGIINLATLDDDDQEFMPAQSPSADFDFFEEDSPSNRRRRSGFTPPKDDRPTFDQDRPLIQSRENSNLSTPPSNLRGRKDSSANAKTVLEHIHQQRTEYDPAILDAKIAHKKLPFDTTSLKDLVTRAGVVTRALKEEIRRAEGRGESPALPFDEREHQRSGTPPDPPFSQMFHRPPPSPTFNKSPRIMQSPKSPKSAKSNRSTKSTKSSRSSMLGGSIASNDNDINGHMKMMTVV